MCLPMFIVRKALGQDILKYVDRYLVPNSNSYSIRIRTSSLYRLFSEHFGFKYQRGDKLRFSRQDFIKALRITNVCSPFKFRKRDPKRCKIIRSRVAYSKANYVNIKKTES